MSTTSLRFKYFDSIVITNNQFEKFLTIHLPDVLPDNISVSNLLSYLKTNGWVNYKFSGYSIKPQVNEHGVSTVVILSYIPPTINFHEIFK